MEKNKQIETSRRVYTWLLIFYPQEYRSEYGAEMAHLFTDQCRLAINQRGRLGLAALWLRTLVDLGKTALIEQLSSPQAKNGLLQATPGMALPWKGVLLVLIPGLVFFISQIGQLTGKDWFFTTLNWAGYAFLVPTLFIWWRTKKFPVWGLVPVGLVFRTLVENDAFGWLYRLSLLFVLPLRDLIQPGRNLLVGDGFLGIPLLSIILVVSLAWLVFRRQKLNRAVWLWLGIYVLIIILQPLIGLIDVLKVYQLYPKNLTQFYSQVSPWVFDLLNIYPAVLFLLLVLLGSLLARRHGQVAILLLLGYLLPVILYGTYETFQGGNTAHIPPVWINTVVFTYRLCIAILAPIWLVRSVSRRRQTMAIMIPMLIALLSQFGLELALNIAYNSYFWRTWQLRDIVGTFSSPLETIAGFILALVLYRSNLSIENENLPSSVLANTAISE